jgi:hypothetical protein
MREKLPRIMASPIRGRCARTDVISSGAQRSEKSPVEKTQSFVHHARGGPAARGPAGGPPALRIRRRAEGRGPIVPVRLPRAGVTDCRPPLLLIRRRAAHCPVNRSLSGCLGQRLPGRPAAEPTITAHSTRSRARGRTRRRRSLRPRCRRARRRGRAGAGRTSSPPAPMDASAESHTPGR